MKNGDIPANPIIDKHGYVRKSDFDCEQRCYGLTKREHFAIEAMQGLLASERPNYSSDPEGNARMALENADALLKALENDK